MDQVPISQHQTSSTADQAAEWVRSIRALSKRSGCERAVAESLAKLEISGPETINVAIVGGSNSGKSNLANALIERNLLPVSPLPSYAAFAIDGTASGGNETFTVANARRPLSQLSEALKLARGSSIDVAISIENEWLKSQSVCLIEKPALDADTATLSKAIDLCLRDADSVVLVVDAEMPVKKAEAELLREVAARRIPTVMVLTKLANLMEDERSAVVKYVEQQVRQYLPNAGIVQDDRDELKANLDSIIRESDFASLRFAQYKRALLTVLDALAAAAHVGAEAKLKSQAQLNAELTNKKNQVDRENLVWTEIEHQLQLRREKIEKQIRMHLISNQDRIASLLSYDLDKTNDVKTWWEHDMPFRLRHELQVQAASISSSIDRQLAADRRWLQEELHRQFGCPLAIGPEAAITIEESDVAGRPLTLTNSNNLKIVTRVGQAAAVIAAGTLFATAGIGGAVVGTSLLVGLAAEHLNHRQISLNREKVRGELNTVIGQSCVGFAADVSAKLKTWYDDVIASIHEYQDQWQQAQIQALEKAKQNSHSASGLVDWADIQHQIQILFRQIKSQLSA